MTTPQVHFVAVDPEEPAKTVAPKVARLFRDSGLAKYIGKNDLTAIKMHFGERKNTTHIAPALVRPVVEVIKKRGAKPFLTDTCVLYKSPRDNAVGHLALAQEQGFTLGKVGAPVMIADGLVGNAEREVEIPGKIFQSVSIANVAFDSNAIVVLTHVTGHIGAGLGGAIKNLGMGFASRKGKLRQHSVSKPSIVTKACTGCWECADHCPTKAIGQDGETASIDNEVCIGCGECVTACRFDAIKFDWNRSDYELQELMAEHALGAVIKKKRKVVYLNYLMAITKDCDCFNKEQTPCMADIGIIASDDPVAIDAASLDLIEEAAGRSLSDMAYPEIDPKAQLRHGETIGLGRCDYELVRL